MEVSAKAGTYQTEYEGYVYYFCSRGCLLDFDENPADFLGEPKRERAQGRFGMGSGHTPLVYEIMSPEVPTIQPNMSLVAAAKKMSATSSASVIVVDKKGQAIGIVTEADIVRKVVSKGLSPAGLTVKYAMSCPLITIDSSADILEAFREMTRRGVKRLVVLDKGKLVGIIRMSDLVRVTPSVVGLLSELAQLSA